MTFSRSHPIRNTALALVVGGALAAVAQVRVPADSDAPPDPPGKVVSDAQPLPAEDRDSHGAIVLKDQPVKAQAAAAGESTGVTGVVGGRVSRLLERAKNWDDVREAEAESTRTMGGPR
jgi:hypothetical protein